jgi:4-amino-4-deoxy-L-arabinose transferase-like glycosyltransferase
MDERSNEDVIISEQEQAETAEPEQQATTNPPRWVPVAGIVCLLVSLLIYVLRLDRVFGLFTDDAWYVLLAKSLATGHGYSLLNSPAPDILPLYPPAFPFILSLVYRLAPDFPENVQWLKGVSVMAMMGVGVCAYRYFVRDRGLSPFVALGIAFSTVLSPMLVFLATSTVMSECVFTLNFLLVILVVERCVKQDSGARGLQLAALAAALASTAFLMRSTAVSLILAVLIYLVKEKLTKAALLFAVLSVLLCSPWVIYSRLHTPTPQQQQEQGGHIVQPYTTQFWQRRAGFAGSGRVSVADLPGRVWDNLTTITGRDVARIISAPVFEFLRNPYEEAKSAEVQAGGSGSPLFYSFLLSALVIAGFISVVRKKITLAEIAVLASLGITVLWPWETVRFVLPLIPFLTFYFLLGCAVSYQGLLKLLKREPTRTPASVMSAVVALLVLINLFGNVTYILRSSGSSALDRPQWLQIFDGIETMLKWVAKNQPKGTVLATTNPPLAYLYTESKTVGSDDEVDNWDYWKRIGVRYIVRLPVYPEPIDPAESKYATIYRDRNNPNFRVVDLGPPEVRVAWEASKRFPYERFQDPYRFLPLGVLALWLLLLRAPTAWKSRARELGHKPVAVFLVCALLLLLLGIFSMRRKSATADEVTHIPAGYTHLAQHDFRMNPEHPPFIKLLAALPLRFLHPKVDTTDDDWSKTLNAGYFGYKFLYSWNDADKLIFWARLPMLLVSILLLCAVGYVAWELYGWKAGILALLLYLFNPELLAHGQLVTTDLGISCFLFIGVYAFYRALRRLTILNALLFCVAIGCALITKYSGIFILPVLALIGVVFALSQEQTEVLLKRGGEVRRAIKARWGKLAVAASLIVASGLVSLVMIWACYGFRHRISPDPAISQRMAWQRYWDRGGLMNNIGKVAKEWNVVPEAYTYGLLFVPLGTEKRDAFLLGKVSRTGGWRYYFLVSFLVKTPIPLLIFILLGFFFMRRYGAGLTAEFMLLCPAIFFLLLGSLNTLNIGNRHILPIYPFLIVFAAKVARVFEEQRPRLWASAYSLLLAWYIAGTLFLYPHFLAYFNEIAGGPNKGYEWLADSNIDWGQDLKGLAEYLRQRPAEPLYLAYFGSARPEYYGLQPKYLAAWNNETLRQHELEPLNEIPRGALLAVSVNSLHCLMIANRQFPGIEQFMSQLKSLEPLAKIGYSIFIYRMPF